VRVIHDDDEVSSDEDEPLQAWLRSLFPAGGSSSLGTASPVVVAVKAAGAEAATDRRTAEEAAAKEAAGEGSSVPGQVPSSAASAKRAATPSGSSPPAKRPYRGRLETLVCPKVIAPCLFSFLFVRLITSAFRLPDRHRRVEHPAWPPWRVLWLPQQEPQSLQ
jgi:hypothetical protein